MNWDPLVIINLFLCIAIFVLGMWGTRKEGNKTPLYVGIAFILFGFSHLMNILGFAHSLETFLITVRLAAYLLVVYAMYREAKETYVR